MITNWNRVSSNQQGVERFRATNRRSGAWIKRNPDQSAEAGSKSGLFGLGTHTESYFVAPAPSDDVILSRLELSANPPKFEDWKQTDKKTPGTNYYQGRANNLFDSKVSAAITRVGDEAEVKAKVGFFGTEIGGHYFDPAPSDAQILRKISQR